MQKITVFTIFFSVLVVVLVAEFLTNNDLQSGWSSVIPPSSLQEESAVEEDGRGGSVSEGSSSAASADGITQTSPVEAHTPAVTGTNSALPDSPPNAGATAKSEVSTFLDVTGYKIEKITETQLVQMGFDGMRLERASAEGLLFQLLDLSDTVNLSKVRFHLTDGKNVYGVISEFLLADATRAKTFYQNLRQKSSLYAPDVKLNETNSFGESSFYLNDSKRLGTAFLTVLSGNRVYSFSYPKASHEFFKKFIQFLMS